MKVIETILYLMFFVFMLEFIYPPIIKYFSFSLKDAIREPWRFFTNVFLHAGPYHLIFNFFVIYSLGEFIEREIGSKNMLILFLVSSLVSNITFGIMHPTEYAIGSSGFAFAITGIATVLNPDLPIIVWYIPTRMGVAGITFFLLELTLAALFPESQIAHLAHVGGFIVGAIFGWYFRRKIIRYYEEYYYF